MKQKKINPCHTSYDTHVMILNYIVKTIRDETLNLECNLKNFYKSANRPIFSNKNTGISE